MSGARPGVAILGAGGYIGQHFARLLADHPWFGPPRLVGSGRSETKTLGQVWQLSEEPPPSLADAPLRSIRPAGLARDGVRLAFSALPSGVAGPIETACLRAGISVFTNASDHRWKVGVPLLVPEVNASHVEILPRNGKRPVHVANPNCSTTGLVLALAPVLPLLRPRAVHVTTYQALSGAGFPGLSSLAIADNIVPFIAAEEEKIAREAARLLGRRRGTALRSLDIPIVANCARVGVRDGHLEAVTVDASARPRRDELLDAWHSFDPLGDGGLPTAPHPPVLLKDEPDRPQPRRDLWAGAPTAARGMAVTIGRVRWDPPFLRFFLLSHNAVRGGAGGSVLNAELAASTGRLPGFGPGSDA